VRIRSTRKHSDTKSEHSCTMKEEKGRGEAGSHPPVLLKETSKLVVLPQSFLAIVPEGHMPPAHAYMHMHVSGRSVRWCSHQVSESGCRMQAAYCGAVKLPPSAPPSLSPLVVPQ
jgi:hypothetical protein